jgi:predicted dehydrogenase
MINLGIAGMGFIGRVHLDASRHVLEARVVAVATRRPEKIRDSYPALQIYSHYEDLVRDDRLDAVLICVPTYLHEQVALAAVESGRHILCEKAMALDAPSAQRMLHAAQRHGRILMVAHVLRFWPQYARIKELVDSGEIGAVRSITAERLATYPPWGEWFRDPEKSGGCILDLQVHDVDFIHWILGNPRSVHTVGVQSPMKSWDHVHTTLAYAGAQATIEASLMMPRGWPFSTSIRILGTEGALEYSFRVGTNIQEREEATCFFRLYKSDGTATEPEVTSEDMYVAQLRYFARCIAAREAPLLCPAEESYQVMQVMAASRRSADNGQIIRLDSVQSEG